MNTKKRKLTEAVLLGGMALLLAGCVKESAINEKYRPAGTPITFSAATGYENGTGTRTEYSGDLYGESPQYERIDWMSEDPIAITYVHSGTTVAAKYAVTEVNGDSDERSTAEVEVASGSEELVWGEGDGGHTFFAMYPSTGFKGNNTASLTNGNHVTGHVPASQSVTYNTEQKKYLPAMEYAYMVACKEIAGNSSESRVTLPFTPAFTAFEFRLQREAGSAGLKVTGVRLSTEYTVPVAGTFAFDITGGNERGAIWDKTTDLGYHSGGGRTRIIDLGQSGGTTITNGSSSISMTFPEEGGVEIPERGGSEYLDFTLLAVPVDLFGLTLTLVYADGSENSLPLGRDASNLDWQQFEGAKKYIITNGTVPGEWNYTIEATNPSLFSYLGGSSSTAKVKSYKQKGNKKVAAPWTVEGYYLDADCTVPMPDGENWIVSFNGSGSGAGSVNDTNIPIVYLAAPEVKMETITPEATALNALVAGTELGSATNDNSGYKNLSNPTNMDSDDIAESANSYIVNRVGYYRIPLVMGSGVKDNGLNLDICWKGHDGREDDGNGNMVYKNDWRVLYKDYLDHTVTSPYLNEIGTPATAEITWEDIEGLVETDENYNLPDGCISSDGRWLRFHVPAERAGAGIIDGHNEPRQGNASIAVRDAAGRVMWSYHIWVTDFVPSNYPDHNPAAEVTVTNPFRVVNKSGVELARTNLQWRLMTKPLGFVKYGQTITTSYPAHQTVYARLVQTESGLEAVVKMEQGTNSSTYQRDEGHPNYQYGRNMALWPLDYVNQIPVWYGKSPSIQNNTLQGPVTLGQSIQHPDKFLLPGSGSYTLETIQVLEDECIQFNPTNVPWANPDQTNSAPSTSWYKTDIFPLVTVPVNLWAADLSVAWVDGELSFTSYDEYEDASPYNIIGTIYHGSRVANEQEKALYNPCPSGYRVISMNGFLNIQINHLTSDGPTEMANPGWKGFDDLINSVSSNHITLYTNQDKTSTYSLPLCNMLNSYGMQNMRLVISIGANLMLAPTHSDNLLRSLALITPDSGITREGVLTGGQAGPILPMADDDALRIDAQVFPTEWTPWQDWLDFLNSYHQ